MSAATKGAKLSDAARAIERHLDRIYGGPVLREALYLEFVLNRGYTMDEFEAALRELEAAGRLRQRAPGPSDQILELVHA